MNFFFQIRDRVGPIRSVIRAVGYPKPSKNMSSTLSDLVAKLVSLGDERLEKFDDKLQEQVSWLDETVAQTRASMRQYATRHSPLL